MYLLLWLIFIFGIDTFAKKVRGVAGWPWVIGATVINVAAYLAGNFSDIAFTVWTAAVGLVTIIFIVAFTKSPNDADVRKKKCTYCAETIKEEAQICKHCGRDCPPSELEQLSSSQP